MKLIGFPLSRWAVLFTAALLAPLASAQSASDGVSEVPFGAFVPGIDVTSKDEVAMLLRHWFYKPVYFTPSGVFTSDVFPIPTNWTGNTPNCVPGTISHAFQQSGIRQINAYRVLSGTSAAKMDSGTIQAKAQAGALIQGANKFPTLLTHTPPATAKCYSSDAAEGAGNSLLGMRGVPSATDLTGFITDGGDNNFSTGHRTHLLYPARSAYAYATTEFIDDRWPDATSSVTAIWTLASDTAVFEKPDFSAWPYPGWFHYMDLPNTSNRWSFSCENCDFESATVEFAKDGVAQAAPNIEARAIGFGWPTIVFNPVDVDYSLGIGDFGLPKLVPLQKESIYDVLVRNVQVHNCNGAPAPCPRITKDFAYSVKVFDADAHTWTRHYPKYVIGDAWFAGTTETGWGVNFHLAVDGRLVATWHTFDAAGNPLWAVMPSGYWTSDSTVAGRVYTTTGSPFANNFSASDTTFTDEGLATLSFASANSVTMQATLRGTRITKTLQRYAANPADTAITDGTNFNGIWQVDGERAWMVSINHRYQTIFATLYTYDATGKPVWYALPACTLAIPTPPSPTTSRTCSGTLNAFRATASPLTGSWTAANLITTPVGNASFTFTDDNTATLTFTINGVTRTKNLSRELRADVLGRVPAPTRQGGVDLDASGKGQIVLRSNTANGLLTGRWNGSALTWIPQTDPGPNYRLLAAGDFDGNGKSDLAFLNTSQGTFGDVKTWSAFDQNTETFWRQVKPAWVVQSVADLDGDGYTDLVWRWTGGEGNPNDVGVSYIWFTNGAAVTQVRKRGGAPLSWKLLGAADLNGDGAADMVYQSPDNTLRVLMATPNRTCANLAAGSIPAGFEAVKLADFSASGRAEVLVRLPGTGALRLLALDARNLTLPRYTGTPDDPNASCTASSGQVANVSRDLPATDPTWTFYASADLNGDGITDLVWRRPDGSLTVWWMTADPAAPITTTDAGTAPVGFGVVGP